MNSMVKMERLLGLVSCILFATGPLDLCAQQPPSATPARPTVGIALQCGGAKGLAHIGVLQWMEEHRIPVDDVAGTSMGGLIGGLYATGRRPSDIRQIVDAVNWDDVLNGATPYRDLAFRRKQDLRAFPNSVELGLRHGISPPGGLNPGQSVLVLMDRYVLPYSDQRSFDDLPIPFRCVATDLISGKAEVFSKGSLATAMRATMSIPGVFAPVKRDGKIYADGGLLNNLPTDVVRQMGADVVIGVHLTTGPPDLAQFCSMFGVAGGSSDVMIDANELRGMEQADILITVDVAGYSTLDFSHAGKIIAKGYEAAEAKANILSRLSLNEADWQRYLSRRDGRRVNLALVPKFIEVEGTSKELSADIRKSLATLVRQPIDTTKLEKDLTELIGLGRFNSLGHSLMDRDGMQGLLITAEERDFAPPLLKPGFTIDGSNPDSVGFTFGSRLTFLDVGGYRSEVRADFAFGSIYGASVEYYHPFTPLTHWFVAPRVFVGRNPLDVYSENSILAEYRLTSVGGVADIGYEFDRFSELRVGYQSGYLWASRFVGSPLLPTGSGRTGASHMRYALDRLDNPIIPRSGVALLSKAKWVDANLAAATSFPTAEATFEAFVPISSPGSVYAVAAGGTTFGYRQTGIPEFLLGGPAHLAAYGVNEFLVNQYFYFRAGYLHRIAKLPALLGGNVYFTGLYEVAKPYGLVNGPRLPNDGAVGLVTQTILGPVLVGFSSAGADHNKFFFELGRVF
jgi:NTE family protein